MGPVRKGIKKITGILLALHGARCVRVCAGAGASGLELACVRTFACCKDVGMYTPLPVMAVEQLLHQQAPAETQIAWLRYVTPEDGT